MGPFTANELSNRDWFAAELVCCWFAAERHTPAQPYSSSASFGNTDEPTCSYVRSGRSCIGTQRYLLSVCQVTSVDKTTSPQFPLFICLTPLARSLLRNLFTSSVLTRKDRHSLDFSRNCNPVLEEDKLRHDSVRDGRRRKFSTTFPVLHIAHVATGSRYTNCHSSSAGSGKAMDGEGSTESCSSNKSSSASGSSLNTRISARKPLANRQPSRTSKGAGNGDDGDGDDPKQSKQKILSQCEASNEDNNCKRDKKRTSLPGRLNDTCDRSINMGKSNTHLSVSSETSFFRILDYAKSWVVGSNTTEIPPKETDEGENEFSFQVRLTSPSYLRSSW